MNCEREAREPAKRPTDDSRARRALRLRRPDARRAAAAAAVAALSLALLALAAGCSGAVEPQPQQQGPSPDAQAPLVEPPPPGEPPPGELGEPGESPDAGVPSADSVPLEPDTEPASPDPDSDPNASPPPSTPAPPSPPHQPARYRYLPGTSKTKGAPVLVARKGLLYLYLRDAKDRLVESVRNAAGAWSTPRLVPNQRVATGHAAAAVVDGAGVIRLAVRGTDGTVYTASRYSTVFSSFKRVSALKVIGRPALVFDPKAKTVRLFVVGRDTRKVYESCREGVSFGAFAPVAIATPPTLKGGLAAVVDNRGYVRLLGRAADDTVQTAYQIGSVWLSFRAVSGLSVKRWLAAAVVDSGKQLVVYAAADDGAVWYNLRPSYVFKGWHRMPAKSTAAPSAVLDGADVRIAGRLSSGTVYTLGPM